MMIGTAITMYIPLDTKFTVAIQKRYLGITLKSRMAIMKFVFSIMLLFHQPNPKGSFLAMIFCSDPIITSDICFLSE